MAAARLRVNTSCPDPPSRGGASAGQVAMRGLASWLTRVAPASARGDLCVALVSDRRMRALNRQFRGKDHATDVLAFPSDERGFLGDIVIAEGVAKRQAKDYGHSLKIELQTLALHGLLHLLGYDHETDDGKMARAEVRLRKAAGLPLGLIERTPAPPKSGRP